MLKFQAHKPSAWYVILYCQVWHKTPHYANVIDLCVPYNLDNKQPSIPYTASSGNWIFLSCWPELNAGLLAGSQYRRGRSCDRLFPSGLSLNFLGRKVNAKLIHKFPNSTFEFFSCSQEWRKLYLKIYFVPRSKHCLGFKNNPLMLCVEIIAVLFSEIRKQYTNSFYGQNV